MKSPSRSVLALMAHPDDIEILCAGTLIHLKRKGWRVHLATMTAGDCGSKTHKLDEIRRIRVGEAAASAKLLGATYDCLGEPDMLVNYTPPVLRKVVELVRKYQPALILTHPPSDYHADHESTSRAVRVGCFGAGIPNLTTEAAPPAAAVDYVPHLYYSDSLDGRDIFGQRVPVGLYVDTSATTALKAKMLSCHKSQRQWLKDHHGVDNLVAIMKEWSAKRGKEIKTRHAEGYRQHLGSGYPQDDLLAQALADLVQRGDGYVER